MRLRQASSFALSIGVLISTSGSLAQVEFLTSPSLQTTQGTILSLPPSNSVTHLATRDSTLWAGTSKGLARTSNGGKTWESFRGVPQFANDGIFAVALRSDTVWTSTGFTKRVNDQNVQTGSGYTFSVDNGASWNHVPQTLDAQGDSLVNYGSNVVRFLPIIVNEQNVTFDIALGKGTVWIASWSSGLRKSTNLGQTWQRAVLPSDSRSSISPTDVLDNYIVDPRRNNNFLVFSVYVENDSTIWAGSAGGINKSTDGGTSWVKFTTLSQTSTILGNWVIAIAGQTFRNTRRIWTTNWRADLDPKEQFGISYTEDGGTSWRNFLPTVKAYDFAFKDSIVYVATDDGIFRTDDGGLSWNRSGTIFDPLTGQRLTSSQFFSVKIVGDTVYCGGSDGIAKTIDNVAHPFGQSWQILRTYRPVGNTPQTYAYPNPFSPNQERVRFHYSTRGNPASVTIEVFDFGMNRVRTIVKDAQRSGSVEHDEIWDGRDENNLPVANGVYFYRVIIDGSEPSWGKLMVLQ